MPQTSGTRHGNGSGWGGRAKGATALAPQPFTPGDDSRRNMLGQIPPEIAALLRMDRRDELRRRMMAQLIDRACMAERDADRINATQAVLDRIDGKPVQANLNMNTDDVRALSDDALRAELARASGEALAAVARNETPPDSE